MSDNLSPIGFWSYARQDDEQKLSALRSILQRQLQQKYGRESIRIFQDVAAIPPGADWNHKITEALNSSTFLIPIITPNFLESEWCNQEFFLFLEREQAIAAAFPELADSRRIFPIFYIDIDDVDPFRSDLLPELQKRQWTNFRDLIYKDDSHETVRLRLDQIAESIVKVLRLDQRAIKARKTAAAAQQASEEAQLKVQEQRKAEQEAKEAAALLAQAEADAQARQIAEQARAEERRVKELAEQQARQAEQQARKKAEARAQRIAEQNAREALAQQAKETEERQARAAEQERLQKIAEQKTREENEARRLREAEAQRQREQQALQARAAEEQRQREAQAREQERQRQAAAQRSASATQPTPRPANAAASSTADATPSFWTAPKAISVGIGFAAVVFVLIFSLTSHKNPQPQPTPAASNPAPTASTTVQDAPPQSSPAPSSLATASTYDLATAAYSEHHYAAAVPLYTTACQQGTTQACVDLGNIYRSGKGVKPSMSKAESLYQQACKAGDQGGCTQLHTLQAALSALNGQGTSSANDQAARIAAARKALAQ